VVEKELLMTLQKTPERRPKKIDLNLLPSEFRPAKKSKLSLILYMTIFVLVCAIAPLIIMKSGVDSDSNSLKIEQTGLQQQLATLQANKNEADGIKSQITPLQDQLATAKADDRTFHNDSMLWSQIITEIDDLVPGKKITLSSIGTSANNKVSLPGVATRKMYVYDFAVDLEASDFFTDVNFNFGDCPDIAACNFAITVSVNNASQMEGGVNE
jgi:Tfp pilus assembly protein PilN